MFDTEVYLIGLNVFLGRHREISVQLRQAVMDIKKELAATNKKLVQFSVTPLKQRSAVNFDLVRESATMTIMLTDDDPKYPGAVYITGHIVTRLDTKMTKLDVMTRETLAEAIKKFNTDFGSTFFDPDDIEKGMTHHEYAKLQTIKAIVNTYLNDKKLSGVGVSCNEVIFYLAKKLSKKTLTKIYPESIEGVPVVCKYAGVFTF